MADSDIATLGINVDSRQVRTAESDLRNLERQGSRTEQSTNAMGAAFKSLTGIIAAVGFGSVVRDMVRTAEQIQNVNLRIQGLTKSTQDYANVTKYLSDISDKHHKSNLQMSDSFSKLLVLEQNGIVVRKQSMAILEGLSNVASKTGASAEQLNSAMYGLTQTLSAGTVNMEDLKQVTEPLPGFMNQLADTMGITTAQLKHMVSQGAITSDMFGRVLVASLDKYKGAAEAAAGTLTATYADVANAWQDLVAVIESPVSDVITPVLQAISGTVHGLAQDLQELKAVKDAVLSSLKDSAFLSGINTSNSLKLPSARLGEGQKPQSEGEIYMQAKAAEESKKATEAETKALKEQVQVLLNKSNAHAAVGKSRAASSGAHVKAVSEEQKAQEKLDDAYDRAMKSLQDQNYRLALSARDYEKTKLAAQGLTEAMIEQAMRIYDANQRLEEKNKLTEAEKETMDGLIDQYNRLTLSAREYYQLQLTLKGISPADQGSIMAQYDKNANTESQQDKIQKAREYIKQYTESIDSANTSMQSFGATTNDVIGSSIGGITTLTTALDAMVKNMQANQQALAKIAEDKKKLEQEKPTNTLDSNYIRDLEAYNKARIANEQEYAKIQKKTTSDTIDGFITISGAASAMFEQSSNEAKAFNLISIAGLAAKAAEAVLTQGKGDPYTAFARMAAMAALVSSIVATGGGGGFDFSGGGQSKPPETTTGTGTVLGDKKQESNSVNNVYDLLKSIHAEEYAELRGINKGVGSLREAITGTVTKIFQGGGLSIPAIDTSTKMSGIGKMIQTGSGIGKFDPISNFLLKGLFGTTTKSIVGSGIYTGAFTPGGDVNGMQYATIQKTKKSWFSTKTSYSNQYSELDNSVTEALTSVFKSMSDTMMNVAGSLGKDIGKDIGKRVSSYIVPAMQIDLHGLSGEEASKKLNGVISAALDTMSSAVFGDIIGQYQKLGEGMLETAVRIVAEVAVVRDSLAQTGNKMASNAIELSDALVQAAGGLEQFQQQFANFYDSFFTDTEKQNRLQKNLNDTFAEVYMLLPRTREEYKNIIGALDLTNKLDRDRYSLMLQLSAAADQYYSTLEDKSGNSQEIRNQKARQEIEIMRLLGDASGALAAERKLELEAMDESRRGMQEIIYTLTDLNGTLQSTYDNAAGMLTATFQHFLKLAVELVKYRESLKGGELSTGSPESKYKLAKQSFEDTMKIIQGGKGKTDQSEAIFRGALENLQNVSGDFLKASRDYNASGKDYVKDFNAVQKGLTTGANKSVNVASNAEKQLEKLNDMVSGIEKLNLVMIDVNGNVKKIDSNTWKDYQENKKANDLLGGDIVGLLGNKNGILSQLSKGSPLFKELSNDAVVKALGKNGVLDALMKDGVLEALKTPNGITALLNAGGPIAKALGQDGVLGALGLNAPLLDALGEKGILQALGKKGVLGALTSGSALLKLLGSEGILALTQKGVMKALSGDGAVIKALKLPGVIDALGQDGVLGALGKKGVLGALGKEGVLGALGTDGVLGALTSKEGIKGLLAAGGPIAIALGQKGVLGALGKDGVLGALGKQGVLGALGKDGVLGALGQKGVLGALGKQGVLGALSKNGVLGELDKKLDDKGPVKSAVDLVKDAINGTGGVKAGGLNFAIGSVATAIKDLGTTSSLKGSMDDVAVALAGIKAALVALAKTQNQENKAAAAAAKAEAAAEKKRQQEAARLERERIKEENKAKQGLWGKIVGASNANAMYWNFKNSGATEEQSRANAQGSADWAAGLLTGFDANESLATLEKKLSLVEEFKKFLAAGLVGGSYPHDINWFNDQFRKLDGAHANGLSYVPRDGYIAELHKGERVQTAEQVKSEKATQELLKKIVDELQTSNKKRESVSNETLKKIDAIIEKQEAQTRATKRLSA